MDVGTVIAGANAIKGLFGGGGSSAKKLAMLQGKYDYANYYRNLRETRRVNRENIRFQRQQAAANKALQVWSLNKNAALQREFAKMGIRWKVADATAAGLHPVYGAGLGGSSFSPIQIGGYSGSPSSSAYTQSSSQAPGPDVPMDYSAGLSALAPFLAQQGPVPQQDQVNQAVEFANLELLHAGAAKDRAIAAYYASRAGRQFTYTPAEVRKVKGPALGSRENPRELSEWYRTPSGKMVRLLTQEAAQALEDIAGPAYAVDANPELMQWAIDRSVQDAMRGIGKEWRWSKGVRDRAVGAVRRQVVKEFKQIFKPIRDPWARYRR